MHPEQSNLSLSISFCNVFGQNIFLFLISGFSPILYCGNPLLGDIRIFIDIASIAIAINKTDKIKIVQNISKHLNFNAKLIFLCEEFSFWK